MRAAPSPRGEKPARARGAHDPNPVAPRLGDLERPGFPVRLVRSRATTLNTRRPPRRRARSSLASARTARLSPRSRTPSRSESIHTTPRRVGRPARGGGWAVGRQQPPRRERSKTSAMRRDDAARTSRRSSQAVAARPTEATAGPGRRRPRARRGPPPATRPWPRRWRSAPRPPRGPPRWSARRSPPRPTTAPRAPAAPHDVVPARVLGHQRRALGERQHEDQVEEQLERGDPPLGPKHGAQPWRTPRGRRASRAGCSHALRPARPGAGRRASPDRPCRAESGRTWPRTPRRPRRSSPRRCRPARAPSPARASMSSTAKNRYGTAPGSPPCMPPAMFGAWITNPSPEGPGSKPQPSRPP